MTYNQFRSDIRAAVRGLWSGQTDPFDFTNQMVAAINIGIENAWREGESEYGITPEERSKEEELARLTIISDSVTRINQFAAFIMANSKDNGGLFKTVITRAEMWINRYNEARELARVMAGNDQKLIWIVGPTEHCIDCLRLNGKVKRASFWAKSGINPQSARLNCFGMHCQCRRVPTDAPLSPGPLPSLVGP